MSTAFHFFRRLLCCALLFLADDALQAQGVKVKTTLSNPTAAVGDEVEYRIELDGATNSVRPPPLNVDGLAITGPQLSRSIQMGRGIQAQTSLIYTLQATRPGTYTIPALRFQADGQDVQTQQVALKVEAGQPANASNERVAWAEIVLPKKTAYLGESLPVEIRFFINSAIHWQLIAPVTLDGEGFTKTKLSEPKAEQVERDGRQYDRMVVETTITPIRAGTIKLGPSEIEYQAQIPRAQRKRSRSPFDMFGDDFFSDPFGGFSQVERRKTTADLAELTVKPLPTQGRPASFSGAVGEFNFSADGNPKTVKVGDPITMKLKISGQGNFDRVTAPVLNDAQGWRAYPPSADFKADDETNGRGTKTFECAVIPEVKKTQMPLFAFSFFNPVTEKYVTETSNPARLQVIGEAAATPPPVVRTAPAGSGAQSPAAPAAAVPEVTDIHGINYDFGAAQSLAPLYTQRNFWMLQLVPLALLAGALAGRLRKPKPDAAHLAALRRERASELAKARREGARTAFYDHAARVLQLEAALATGQLPETVDAAAVCRARKANAETAAVIEETFQARAEALFAGGGGGGDEISEADRKRVLAVVERVGGAKS